RNVRYAAPELFTPTVGRHCDQYSLALIYAEMLTGTHPFRGLGPRIYTSESMTPDLAGLPEWDRVVIERALHADPDRRFSSCTEMLLALEGTSLELNQHQRSLDRFTEMVDEDSKVVRKWIDTDDDKMDLRELINIIISRAGGNVEPSMARLPTLNEAQDAMQ